MTEKEREQELFNRIEKREALKTRLDQIVYVILFSFVFESFSLLSQLGFTACHENNAS